MGEEVSKSSVVKIAGNFCIVFFLKVISFFVEESRRTSTSGDSNCSARGYFYSLVLEPVSRVSLIKNVTNTWHLSQVFGFINVPKSSGPKISLPCQVGSINATEAP